MKTLALVQFTHHAAILGILGSRPTTYSELVEIDTEEMDMDQMVATAKEFLEKKFKTSGVCVSVIEEYNSETRKAISGLPGIKLLPRIIIDIVDKRD